MNRSIRALALALALTLPGGLAVSGCCSCRDGEVDLGPKRPGDVVRDLRDAISQQQWAVAKACFTDELQAQNSAAMLSGEFFRVKAHADTLADGKLCACLDGPAGREPDEVVVDYPLGAGDVVLAVAVEKDVAEATIAPLHPAHARRATTDLAEPRPQTIVLKKSESGWKIAELKLATPPRQRRGDATPTPQPAPESSPSAREATPAQKLAAAGPLDTAAPSDGSVNEAR